MSNPTTVDRRDVGDRINPIGGHDHVEEVEAEDFVESLNPQGAGALAAATDAFAARMQRIVPRTRGAH